MRSTNFITNSKMKSLLSFTFFLLIFSAGLQANGNFSGDPFAGKTFNILLTEVNEENTEESVKKEGVKEQLIFKDNRFEVAGKKSAEYIKTRYTVGEKEGKVTFEVKIFSPQEGIMVWTGTLDGNVISGTALWQKKNKEIVNYSYSGSIAE